MSGLFMLLFLISLICFIRGLINPNKMIFWKEQKYRTKKNVIKYFGIAMILFSILSGAFNSNNSTKNNTKVMSNNNIEDKVESKQTQSERPKEIKKTGWTQEKGNWYYYDENGKPKTGWFTDNGKDYYLDNSGIMQTGWKESNGKWYYLNSDGSMATNTTVDGYYLATNGAMQEKSVSNQSNNTTTNEPVKSDKIVYWVSGGKSYHYSRNCPTLARSKNIQQGTASSCPKTDPCDKCTK